MKHFHNIVLVFLNEGTVVQHSVHVQLLAYICVLHLSLRVYTSFPAP